MKRPQKSRNIKSKNSWKPVELEGPILSSSVDGLIGIEELTDYTLINDKSASIKRKGSKNESDSGVECDSDNNSEPAAKMQKVSREKRKKKPQVSPQATKPNASTRDDNIPAEIPSSVESNFNSEAWSSLGVPGVILKALEEQEFSTPTAIQSLTLGPALLGRRDILGAAETGSGKTLAFGIPILAGILEEKQKQESESLEKPKKSKKIDTTNGNWSVSDNNSEDEDSESEDYATEDGIGCVKVIDNIESEKFNVKSGRECLKPLYALILTPTRELAIQVKNHLCKAAKYTDIKIAVVVGGMAAVKQERILSKGPEIVIATPGRLWELIQQGNLHLNQLGSIKYLAIDETDRMLERGHFQELHEILEKIHANEAAASRRQTFVFSATLTLVHDIPDYLQRKKNKNSQSKIFKLTPGQKLQKIIHLLKIKNPKIIDVTKQKGTVGTLTEYRIACTIDYKDHYLYYFLQQHQGRTLVFCNSIGCVRRLATLFGILNCNPLPLHASMPQRQRLKNLERFQDNSNGLLIATDVAARGLDIPNVEHVIHYQVPRTSECYVHRSGRTARAQKTGISVLLMEPSELQNYTKLCKTLGRTKDIPSFPVVDRMLLAVRDRVIAAREVDRLELICRRANARKSWIEKAAEELDLLLDDELETTMENKEFADLRRQLKAKRQQLSSLLSKPAFPKGFSGKYPETNISCKKISN